MYDYIIVGGGPSGLTLAYCLGQQNKILLIDNNKTLGGCHRVVRTKDNLFTEHGPRVYASSYVNTKEFLRIMGLSFNDYFSKYNFGFSSISTNIFKSLSFNEIKSLSLAFLFKSYNDMTMAEFMDKNNFSESSRKLIDNLCRLTDGGDSTRYLLYEFLQLANQNAFYSFYVNKIPNDVGLMKDWTLKLIETGNVDIMTNSQVTEVLENGIKINKKFIKGKNIILAIPPQHLVNLLEKSSPKIRNSFGDFNQLKEWEIECRYETYICGMLYWEDDIKTEKTYGGFTDTDWGIMFIELSDYMKFDNMKNAICVTISKPDAISQFLGKTPHECTEKELLNEIVRQINLPEPSKKILYPNIIKENNRWVSKDTSFLLTKAGYGPCKSLLNNLFSVGVHNGRANFVPTTIEAAIENAIHLVHDLNAESKNKYKLKRVVSIFNVLNTIMVILILAIAIKCGSNILKDILTN
jgi:hypothetical protein